MAPKGVECFVSDVTPGVCVNGCPTPTEIDCIEVTKVYDFCFQQDTFNNICTALPSDCHNAVTTSCALTSSNCTFVSSTPVSTGSNFMNVTFAISATFTVTLYDASGHVACTVPETVNYMKTVTLCAPSGTVQSCTVAGATCGPCAIINNTVCCGVTLCVLFQSTALVTLLVPSYGFCTPAACAVLPSPACPPVFPTQCT